MPSKHYHAQYINNSNSLYTSFIISKAKFYYFPEIYLDTFLNSILKLWRSVLQILCFSTVGERNPTHTWDSIREEKFKCSKCFMLPASLKEHPPFFWMQVIFIFKLISRTYAIPLLNMDKFNLNLYLSTLEISPW